MTENIITKAQRKEYFVEKNEQEKAIIEMTTILANQVELLNNPFNKKEKDELSNSLSKLIHELGWHWIESLRVKDGTSIFENMNNKPT